jgi:hypothetical protein
MTKLKRRQGKPFCFIQNTSLEILALIPNWFEEYLGSNQTRKDAEHKLRLAGIKIDHMLIPDLFVDIRY